MGGGGSKNVAENLVETVSSIVTNKIMNTNIRNNSSQIFKFETENGDINLDGIVQRIVIEVNMQALMSDLSTSESQQQLTLALTQASQAIVEGINIFQFTESQNLLKSLMTAVVDISTDVSQNCAAEINNLQYLSATAKNGNIIASNLIQEQLTKIFVSCLLESVTESRAIQELQAMLDQESKAKSQGISEWALVTLGVLAFLALLCVTVVPLAIGATVIMKNIVILLCVAMWIAGIVLIIMYFTGQSNEFTAVPYTKGIASTSECEAIPMGLPSSTEICKHEDADGEVSVICKDPVQAAILCENTEGCVAFDWMNWNGTNELPTPVTKLYMSVNERCVEHVSGAADPDIRNFMQPRQFISDRGSPPEDLTTHTHTDNTSSDTIISPGTVYINSVDTSYYIYERNGWERQPGRLIEQFQEGQSFSIGLGLPLESNMSDWYVDVENPVKTTAYKKTTSGSWEGQEAPALGYNIDLYFPPNTSGFAYTQKASWMLIVGITLLVLGVLCMIIYFSIAATKKK